MPDLNNSSADSFTSKQGGASSGIEFQAPDDSKCGTVSLRLASKTFDMNEDLHRIRAEKLERKGLKKLKKLQATQAEALKASDATVSTLDVNGIPASSIPKADDAAKLTKKNKRKQQPENGNVESQAEPEGEKVKKKKKKHLQPEAAPQTAAVCAAGDKPDGLQKPKQKNTGNAAAGPRPAQPTTYEEVPKLKKKKLKASGTAKGASLAEVGDQELARTGQPVQKALYSEHPAVTQMSEAAVQQWREERETAVTGCDIKPVTAFDQAGEALVVFLPRLSNLPCSLCNTLIK